jgi:hypothetical protein
VDAVSLSRGRLVRHLDDFFAAYTSARRLKTLNGLTPYEFICKRCTIQSEPVPASAGTIHLNVVVLFRPFISASKALSAGPACPAEILPGTAICIALRIKGLRTRVFRRIELEHHPLRVRNTRIRGRVQ